MQLRAADLFCGGGGTSAGAHATGGVDVVFALNHWQRAIETHSANFPGTHHVNSRLEDTSPNECGKIDLLFASPECTHHSRARGGMPTSDQQRSGAWQIFPWIEAHRPRWIVVENVSEFREWGPVDPATGHPLKSRKGAYFDNWLRNFWAAGYRVDVEELNAANFGAATSRNRLFIIARKGNRNPIFPEPTHGKQVGGELPGMGLSQWRPASEVIDWSIPCPSIFHRKRPLADKTLLRIEAGLRRFVGPFVSSYHGGKDFTQRNYSLGSPIPTQDTSNRFALVQPFALATGSCGAPRHAIEPLPTIVTKDGTAFVTPFQIVMRNNMSSADIASPLNTITAGWGHHGIAVPFMADVNHGGGGNRVQPLNEALGTLTTHNGKALAVPFLTQWDHQGSRSDYNRPIVGPLATVLTKASMGVTVPWLSPYYGNSTPSDLNSPLDTITTKDRHSLCVAMCQGPQDWPAAETEAMRTLQATMLRLGVCDIGFRMLSNPELSAAQGFPRDYIYCGKKSEITRQIGNSVSPPVAEAITRAILGA